MSAIRDYVMQHDLFCHHDHHQSYAAFDADREDYTFDSLLGYAWADLTTAAGPRAHTGETSRQAIERLWPAIRLTGYGRAVDLGCRALFGLPYAPEHFDAITEALQGAIRGRTAAEVYTYFVHEKARNRWTIHDSIDPVGSPERLDPTQFPDSYRSAFRMDSLFSIADDEPIDTLERFTGRSIHTLDQMVDALNAAIDRAATTGRLAALKIGMAYGRDLTVGDPTHHEAELAFNRIRNRKHFWGGIQQEGAAVDAAAGRALGDYLFHAYIRRAADDDLPVQIHTGYLAGNWGSLNGTPASRLIPIFNRYRTVRFDIFHASWPWTSELGAIGKNYPNVWLDMCWAWAMNPGQSARALAEWLDCVPFTKIFAYGADTRLPWCNMGYSLQAKEGIARVLETKIDEGLYDLATAQEVADHIMLRNGEEFFGLA
jgi:predicted TIM-barrel fold metal-dependent hydrolase